MAMPTDCIYKGEQHEHAYAQPWTESERTCDVSVQPLRKGALLFKDSCLLKWIAVLENSFIFEIKKTYTIHIHFAIIYVFVSELLECANSVSFSI